jgi:uncharacterized protein (TIGR02453 family)
MTYFNKNFIEFFKELELNNSTEWFHANKKRYEADVKNPFLQFIELMIKRVQKYESDINITGTDAMMRINKDIRFSKDKSPYHTYVGAIISKYGKKDKGYPGLYFQFSSSKVMVASGAYMVENDVIEAIRKKIAANLTSFSKIYKEKNFVEKFVEIQGEKNKRLPDAFQNLLNKEPLIANKQFYCMAEEKSKLILSENLDEQIMEYYLAAKKLNDFLKSAIN